MYSALWVRLALVGCYLPIGISGIVIASSNRSFSRDVTSFRSAILVYHFRLRNPRNFSTTIIPTSKMDSKEKEKESQNKSGVDYSFPISEYAKQLDFPVRDRYLQKIAAIGIDPVSRLKVDNPPFEDFHSSQRNITSISL